MQRLISLDTNTLKFFGDRPETILTENLVLQIAIATHPDTPRHVLEVLANSDQPEVAEAARLHVNYAGELAGNWQDVVDELFKNRYLGQNDRLAVELLKIAPVPAYFFSEYVPPEYLIQGLSNPYLPLRYRLQLLTRLAQEPTLEPRLQVAESPDTPLPVLEQLIGDLELPIRIAVQYNPHCPPELVQLVTGQHEVASNWDTNTQQLDNLSNSNWDWIRLAVAQNPSSSEATLLKLAGDQAFKIQLAVAKNPVTSTNVLAVLAQHSNQEIQAEVAKHPNTTKDILHSLFNKQQRVIKSRQDLPASIIERIFNESPKDSQVPLFLSASGADISFFTRQPNTPTWILAEFANIDLEKLRIYAEEQYKSSPIMNQVEGWISDRCSGLIELTKHPQVSAEILEQLANFPNERIKLAVAQNSQTPQSLKEQLLKLLVININDYIKVKIASDPETPIEILEQLSGVSSSVNQMIEILGKIVPDITPNLLNEIKAFIECHQSPELILFWLRQGKEFQTSILDDWEQLLAALSDQEKEILEYIASKKFSVKWQGKFTVQRKTLSHSHDQLEPNRTLLENLMYLLNTFYNSDISNQDIIVALLGNSSTLKNLREQLWQKYKQEPDDMGRYSKDAKFRMALAYNTAIPEAERMEYFEQLLSSGNNEYLAKNPQTPTHILEQIFELNIENKRGRNILEALAKNHATPEFLIRKIADLRQENLWRELAENPNTPSDLLIRFITEKVEKKVHSNKTMLDLVFDNSSLPILNLYQILLKQQEQKEIEKTKRILARRKNIPYILEDLCQTGIKNNTIFTAINSKTLIAILEQLSKNDNESIRRLLAYNPNLSLNAILELAKDNKASVRKAVASQTNNISTSVLETLEQDTETDVRIAVAGNINTPTQVLEQLSQDTEATVRTKVAANSNTPNNVLENLALDFKIEVRHAVANNSNSSKIIKDLLKDLLPTTQNNTQSLSPTLRGLSRIYNPNTDDLPTVLSEYVNSDVAFVRFVSLLHPLIPKEILETAANSVSWIERYAAADNPNTPTEIRQQLTQDSNQVVRAVARDKLAA